MCIRVIFLSSTSPPIIQCTLINFIATEKGLEDQLLAKVVGVERPELEKQAQELQNAFNQVHSFFIEQHVLCRNCPLLLTGPQGVRFAAAWLNGKFCHVLAQSAGLLGKHPTSK